MPLELEVATPVASQTVSKAAVKKLGVVGQVAEAPRTWAPLWKTLAHTLADGSLVAAVSVGGEARIARVGAKDKEARLLEGVAPGFHAGVTVFDEGRRALLKVTNAGGGSAHRFYEMSAAEATVRAVYEGPLAYLHPAADGLLVGHDGDAVVLISPDGGAGRELARLAIGSKDDVGVCHDGRVVLVFRSGPTEAVVVGIYPGQDIPLRELGTLPHRWGGYGFRIEQGRCLFRAVSSTYELRGFAEAYEEGRAGPVLKASPRPDALAFRYLDRHEVWPPSEVVNRLGGYEKDGLRSCVGGGWTAHVTWSRKKHSIAVWDGRTFAMRHAELPEGIYADFIVDEEGTRGRIRGSEGARSYEVGLADLRLRPMPEYGDFGPGDRVVAKGPRLVRWTADDRFETLASLEITSAAQGATALGGKVLVTTCETAAKTHKVAVLGIYGETMKLLAALDLPPNASWLKRWETRVYADGADVMELVNLEAAYARGAEGPGLPLGDLVFTPVATQAPKGPRPTPQLDALIARIGKKPARAVPDGYARLLAGKLPGDVRRLILALAEHEPGYFDVGLDFQLQSDLVLSKVPGPGGKGERADLVVLGGDGGGNLYAVDVADEGAEGRLLFVDHERDFAETEQGRLETLLQRSAAKAKEEADEEGDDDDEGTGGASSGAAHRLTCTEGGANKFWEGAVEGKTLTVRWGKTGTGGQAKTKEFPSEDAARKELEKSLKEKRSKGYVDDP